VASGLLRLTDNHLDRAIDLYQEVHRDHAAILLRAAELDQRQGVSPEISRKRTRGSGDFEIDEMALGALASMGVANVARAREALRRHNNDVERALLWLTAATTTTTSSGREDSAASAAPGPDRAAAAVVSPQTVGGTPRATHHDLAEDDTALDEDDDDDMDVDDDAAAASSEEEAIELLERVLGEVLQEQEGSSDENLGNSLDEEWSYIEKYRSGTTSG